MPRNISAPPPESVRDWLIVRDGWLWWNPEKATHGKYTHDRAIRFGNDADHQTVNIEGRAYRVARLNYWIHTGEWPECVIHRDHDLSNNHIDNLMPANSQQSNYHRKFDRRTYTITEYVRKDGKRTYYPLFNAYGKKFVVGSYDNEQDAVNAAIMIRKLMHGEYLAEDIKQILNH